MPAPANTVIPAITGTQEVGYTLTCSTGSWTHGVDSYAYQWQQSFDSTLTWVDIGGAIASTYVILADDVGYKLRCKVTATNGAGSTVAISNETAEMPDDWFIVEDGTGKIDALSFSSIDYAKQYHARRNNTAWGQLGVGVMKSLLVKATDYLEQVYRLHWRGVRKTEGQALSWPRENVERVDYTFFNLTGYYPNNEVPIQVKNACCELALRALTQELAPDIKRVTNSEKIGPLEVVYKDGSKPYIEFRQIDNILAPFLDQQPGGAFKNVVLR